MLIEIAINARHGHHTTLKSVNKHFEKAFLDEVHINLSHNMTKPTPEDHWSCIAHLSAEDMLKSVVIEEKKFKHSPWAGADKPLGPKFLCQQEGLITMVICCKFKHLFHDLNMYVAPGQGLTTPWDEILMSTGTPCHFSHLLQVSKRSL